MQYSLLRPQTNIFSPATTVHMITFDNDLAKRVFCFLFWSLPRICRLMAAQFFADVIFSWRDLLKHYAEIIGTNFLHLFH